LHLDEQAPVRQLTEGLASALFLLLVTLAESSVPEGGYGALGVKQATECANRLS
jgi:hypothetical protein